MNKDKNIRPIIATDVDGILVKWQSGLPYFAQKYNLELDHILDVIIADKFVSVDKIFNCDEELAHELIKKYNESDFIRYLAPYDDALEVINRLKNEYRFIAISALGNSIDSLLNRKFNLNSLFPGAFEDIFICSHNEPKTKLFEKAKAKYGDQIIAFVDDVPSHIESAEQVFSDNVKKFWMPRSSQLEAPYGALEYTEVNNWFHLETTINS